MMVHIGIRSIGFEQMFSNRSRHLNTAVLILAMQDKRLLLRLQVLFDFDSSVYMSFFLHFVIAYLIAFSVVSMC